MAKPENYMSLRGVFSTLRQIIMVRPFFLGWVLALQALILVPFVLAPAGAEYVNKLEYKASLDAIGVRLHYPNFGLKEFSDKETQHTFQIGPRTDVERNFLESLAQSQARSLTCRKTKGRKRELAKLNGSDRALCKKQLAREAKRRRSRVWKGLADFSKNLLFASLSLIALVFAFQLSLRAYSSKTKISLTEGTKALRTSVMPGLKLLGALLVILILLTIPARLFTALLTAIHSVFPIPFIIVLIIFLLMITVPIVAFVLAYQTAMISLAEKISWRNAFTRLRTISKTYPLSVTIAALVLASPIYAAVFADFFLIGGLVRTDLLLTTGLKMVLGPVLIAIVGALSFSLYTEFLCQEKLQNSDHNPPV